MPMFSSAAVQSLGHKSECGRFVQVWLSIILCDSGISRRGNRALQRAAEDHQRTICPLTTATNATCLQLLPLGHIGIIAVTFGGTRAVAAASPIPTPAFSGPPFCDGVGETIRCCQQYGHAFVAAGTLHRATVCAKTAHKMRIAKSVTQPDFGGRSSSYVARCFPPAATSSIAVGLAT